MGGLCVGEGGVRVGVGGGEGQVAKLYTSNCGRKWEGWCFLCVCGVFWKWGWVGMDLGILGPSMMEQGCLEPGPQVPPHCGREAVVQRHAFTSILHAWTACQPAHVCTTRCNHPPGPPAKPPTQPPTYPPLTHPAQPSSPCAPAPPLCGPAAAAPLAPAPEASKQANHRLTGVARAPAGSHQRRRRGCTTHSACRTKEEAHSAAQRSRLAAQRRQPLQGPAVGAVDGGHALAPEAQRPHGQARSATYQCTNAY